MAYKKSFLGVSWILIAPIMGIVSWVFMNATGILTPGDVGIPYPAYVLISSSIWGLFMGFYGAAAGTLGAGGGFIMQVNYPHEALLIKQVAQHLANYTIGFAINLIVLLLFGVTPSWGILLFPIMMIPMFFLGSAMGLVLSVISVVASDISSMFNTALGLVFYITPVIYSPDVSSQFLQTMVKLNPLSYLITGARDMLLYGKLDNVEIYLFVTFISFLLFLFALRLFYVAEQRVVEKMI
jgi:lipopolysaccharide transport system permease protein